MAKLIVHFPETALSKLEEVSFLLKRNKALGDYLRVSDIRSYTAAFKEAQPFFDAQQTLMGKKKKKPVEGEEEEQPPEEEPAPVGFVSSILDDQRVFALAGISFGEQDALRIQLSLKKLSATTSAQQVRFFGRIRGTVKDYFIAEATVEGGEDDAKDGDEASEPNIEEKGTGVNKFTYFVTTDLLSGQWTKLPDLKPSQIMAARQIKVKFTGDLQRKVFTNPYFFGTEMHYLRAQIARIAHSTAIMPRRLWKLSEDNERDIEEATTEEGDPVPYPSVLQLANAGEWGH